MVLKIAGNAKAKGDGFELSLTVRVGQCIAWQEIWGNGVCGGVEKVPLTLYNTTIIVNCFQGWRHDYVRYSKTLAGRLVCGWFGPHLNLAKETIGTQK